MLKDHIGRRVFWKRSKKSAGRVVVLVSLIRPNSFGWRAKIDDAGTLRTVRAVEIKHVVPDSSPSAA